MDKQRLTTLINQPDKLEETDFRDLKNLKNDHPYFQALSTLITIGSKKYKPESEKKHLQSAAIYALDRKHLKEILSRDYDSNTTAEVVEKNPQQTNETTVAKNKVVSEHPETYRKPERETKPKRDSKIESTPLADSTHLPDSFFEDLFKEMEALKAEKEIIRKL